MMIIRLSQKLATKLKAGKLDEASLAEDPFADWSCHLFRVEHKQYIIVTHTRSLYSCLLYGKGLTDISAFVERALDTLRESTESDALAVIYRDLIQPASETVRLAKALNRSVVASMNDLTHNAKWGIQEGRPLSEVSARLNKTPMGVLHYKYPIEVFQSLSEAIKPDGRLARAQRYRSTTH